MTLGGLFWMAHVVALAGWIALLAAPAAPGRSIAAARIAGAILAIGYAALFVVSIRSAGLLVGDYSLTGIAAFFADSRLLLVGWVHYLAFDLWVGAWEAEEAARTRMPHGLLVPCLLLTFMLGPIGLLLFLALRARRNSIAS